MTAKQGQGRSRQRLQADIAVTRERVAGDVEALATKLSPEHVKAEAKQAALRALVRTGWQLRRSIIRGATSAFWFARRHPLPVLAGGTGLAFLIWQTRRR